jgi:hypothetical protein
MPGQKSNGPRFLFRVTVEHIHVHAGGQAVVGTVESPGEGWSQKVRNNPMHGTSKEIPNGNADLVRSSAHRDLAAAGAKIVGDVA